MSISAIVLKINTYSKRYKILICLNIYKIYPIKIYRYINRKFINIISRFCTIRNIQYVHCMGAETEKISKCVHYEDVSALFVISSL